MAREPKKVLSPRHHLFVDEYLVSRNATKAAIAAGCTPETAKARGPRMLAHPAVKEKIERETKAASRRAAVDAQWVIEQLMAVAGQEDVAQSTKVRALELLAKHLGMLEERVTVKTDGLTPEQRTERVVMLLERARSRVGGD